MNKFDLIDDPAAMPTRIRVLPELNYPARFNVVHALFDKAEAEGWWVRGAIYSYDRDVDYQGLHRQVARHAGALAEAGVGAGDRVVLRLPDTLELVYCVLALQALGAIAVPTFIQFRDADLDYRIDDTEARLIVVAADHMGEVETLIAAGLARERVVVLGDDPTGRCRSMAALMADDPPAIPYADTEADDIALIAYTSGTTGRPKGTAHSHADLAAAADTFSRHCIAPGVGDIIAGPPSLPFTMGMAFLVFYPLWLGAASIIAPDKSVEPYSALMRRAGATVLMAVPTYYKRLLGHLRETGLTLPSLRLTMCAGEPLYADLEDAWLETTGLALTQCIGTTEMFHAFIGYRPGLDAARGDQTLGRAAPGYEVTVRDAETFAEVPNGTHGLMCVRGPTATAYWSPREIQREMVRDGWNIVQDTIWKDDEGFIHFVARADEMIVTGGFNVAPTDVEQVLMRHPAVLECACVPSPDETGERAAVVKAFVVLGEGHTAGDGLAVELQDYFKANGPPYMYPRKIAFVDALPKGMTGKVLRAELRRREMGA